MSEDVWVVLPVKSFDKSKQRLSQVLNENQRERLAEAMLKDVLQALAKSRSIKQVVVVTSNEEIAKIAYAFNAQVVMEPESCSGLNDAVSLGVHHVNFHGGKKAIILHADIPLANSHDLDFLVKSHLSGSVTIVPDKKDEGTNVLLVEIPAEIKFLYGVGSYKKHLQLFRDLGFVCEIAELHDLMLDIDSPEDLLELTIRLMGKPPTFTSACLLSTDIEQAIIAIGRE